MTVYNAPIADFKFVLNDLLGLDKYANLPGFEEVSPDLVDAILEEAGKVASEVLHPINQSGDLEGCHWNDGVVTTPKGFKEAYDLYVESGWGRTKRCRQAWCCGFSMSLSPTRPMPGTPMSTNCGPVRHWPSSSTAMRG